MGRRKFPLFVLVAIACFITAGCGKRASSEAFINVEAEREIAPQSTAEKADKTAQLKEMSYQNFDGKTMNDILADGADEYVVDFDKFFNLAGLSYDFVGDDIVVTPIGYNAESDFAVMIHLFKNPPYLIVGGSTTSKGRNTDGTWRESHDFNSATDFIFGAILDGKEFLIGADELDFLWREIRVLTSPEDKIEAVNAAVDAELASYYEVPDDFVFPEE